MPPERAPKFSAIEQALEGTSDVAKALKKRFDGWQRGKRWDTKYGAIVPGAYVSRDVEKILDALFVAFAGETLEVHNQEAAKARAEAARLAFTTVTIESDFGYALAGFADDVSQLVEDEIKEIEKLLLAYGRKLVEEEAWWKAETGKRPEARETGKLFGFRNVIHAKNVQFYQGKATGFIWPDPEQMRTAEHLRSPDFNVESGYKTRVVPVGRGLSRGGWMYPGADRGTRPTTSRFYPYSVGKPSGGPIGSQAWWTGPKLAGRIGEDKPMVKGSWQKNKGQYFIARTAELVIGEDGEKIFNNMSISADKLVDKYQTYLRTQGR